MQVHISTPPHTSMQQMVTIISSTSICTHIGAFIHSRSSTPLHTHSSHGSSLVHHLPTHVGSMALHATNRHFQHAQTQNQTGKTTPAQGSTHTSWHKPIGQAGTLAFFQGWGHHCGANSPINPTFNFLPSGGGISLGFGGTIGHFSPLQHTLGPFSPRPIGPRPTAKPPKGPFWPTLVLHRFCQAFFKATNHLHSIFLSFWLSKTQQNRQIPQIGAPPFLPHFWQPNLQAHPIGGWAIFPFPQRGFSRCFFPTKFPPQGQKPISIGFSRVPPLWGFPQTQRALGVWGQAQFGQIGPNQQGKFSLGQPPQRPIPLAIWGPNLGFPKIGFQLVFHQRQFQIGHQFFPTFLFGQFGGGQISPHSNTHNFHFLSFGGGPIHWVWGPNWAFLGLFPTNWGHFPPRHWPEPERPGGQFGPTWFWATGFGTPFFLGPTHLFDVSSFGV